MRLMEIHSARADFQRCEKPNAPMSQGHGALELSHRLGPKEVEIRENAESAEWTGGWIDVAECSGAGRQWANAGAESGTATVGNPAGAKRPRSSHGQGNLAEPSATQADPSVFSTANAAQLRQRQIATPQSLFRVSAAFRTTAPADQFSAS